MAINLQHYDESFGNNHRIILRHPRFGPKLVLFVKNTDSGGWSVRGFTGGRKLTHDDFPGLTIAKIEANASDSEIPPPHSIDNRNDWTIYLKLRNLIG